MQNTGNIFKTRLTPASKIKNSWKLLGGINPDRFLILNSVWKKEIGNLADYCEIEAINKNVVIVKVKSSVIAQELNMRSRSVIRNLNKYFSRPWIHSIKAIF